MTFNLDRTFVMAEKTRSHDWDVIILGSGTL